LALKWVSTEIERGLQSIQTPGLVNIVTELPSILVIVVKDAVPRTADISRQISLCSGRNSWDANG